MTSKTGRMGRVSQPVLPMMPAQARSIGPSAGLLEGPGGGVVFIFGLATFSYGPADEVGRRLAAVQLVATRIATSQEVAAAFWVSGVTLWTWRRDFAAGGVLALVRARTGPRGPIKLTASLAARIAALDAAGATLLKIAALTGVSTATVRVALGRVAPRDQVPVEPDLDVDQRKDCGSAEVADLVVLAPPEPRTTERVAARFGDLVEAPVVITEGAQLPLAGLLLALPALEMTGLLPVAAEVFPPMRKGFYGLRAVLLMGVFLALLREPRAEAATRIRPADLGRLLGLDRAPEVKTLRRKLAELAACGRGALLQAALGRHHATTRPDAVGFLYLDGHVRVYTGTRELPKTHIARMRIAGPATEETWVGDADGDPVMVITAAPSKSLAAELARLLPDLRAIIAPCARSASEAFTTANYQSPDGTAHTYELAERLIDLPVPARPQTGGQPASTLTLRLIVRRTPGGHQTPILPTRTALTGAQVAYRMAARWRQENYFKYAREHFAAGALDSYADQPDDPTRMVPNPAKARAGDQVSAARAQLVAAQGGVADAIDAAGFRARQPGSGGKATVDPAAGQALTGATTDLAAATAASRETPSHLPLGQVRPGSRLLETETKLLTHAIRMSAYNAESALARLLRPHYARGDDEARALLREAFTLSGDLQITGDTLHVRLDPPSAPRRSKALAALCTELTDTATRYPGTDLTLAYGIKGHSDPA